MNKQEAIDDINELLRARTDELIEILNNEHTPRLSDLYEAKHKWLTNSYLFETHQRKTGIWVCTGASNDFIKSCLSNDSIRKIAQKYNAAKSWFDHDRLDVVELTRPFYKEIMAITRPRIKAEKERVKELNNNKPVADTTSILRHSVDYGLLSSHPDLHLNVELMQLFNNQINWRKLCQTRVLSIEDIERITSNNIISLEYLIEQIEETKYRLEKDVMVHYKKDFTFKNISKNKAKTLPKIVQVELQLRGLL